MKVLKIIIGAIVAFFLISAIIGLVSVGNKVNHDNQTSKNVGHVWSLVHVGQTKSEVRGILGKPDDTTKSESSNFEGGTDTYETWMYGTLGSTTYSVDFINGRVESKSSL